VSRLKIVIGWLILAIWLPATSLCLVEKAGWLSADDCCQKNSPDSNPASSAEDSACCALGSSSYKANEDERLISLSCDFVLTPALVLPSLEADHCFHVAGTKAPVHLSVSWQFSSRAALLPRAPSFVS
jgi:hypothetical protein